MNRYALFALFVTGHYVCFAAEVEFNRDIRPLLAKNCFACHGPDEETREADLRLDSASGALADLGGHRAIEPGKPDVSELIKRINSDDEDLVMPPNDSGHQLSAEDKRMLHQWVASGARYDVHWSFTPPAKAELPSVKQAAWPRHPLDHFVLAKLENAGLAPGGEVDRYRLLRRLTLDLTGLPPTPQQADAFIADTSDDAVEKVVDRLLDSDAFGEHWARMWLDLARYADTKGYEKDRPREIWRYRDWVIDALNSDMPFDQFTIEQLAGDLLPNPTSNQLLATAFHRNTMTNDEGGTDNEEFRVAAVKDRVDTTMQVWMGLTMGCAKCHSHKYDPIQQDEYYAFYAYFNQTEDADRSDDGPVAATPTNEQQAQIEELEKSIAQTRAQLQSKPQGFQSELEAWRAKLPSPIWKPLSKSDFSSDHQVTLNQQEDGILIAQGAPPEKDVWRLTLDLPAGEKLTALRLDLYPHSSFGDSWPDRNVALRELSLTLVQPDQQTKPLKLTNPRADFSQRDWHVSKAIDGKDNVGWAVSPHFNQPHCAVFDFAQPFTPQAGSQLQLVFDLQYGQKLLMPRFRVAVSTADAVYLSAELDINASLESAFAKQVFPATRDLHKQLAAQQTSLAKIKSAIPKTPIMRELAKGKQRQTRVQRRGNFLDPGEEVKPELPELFGVTPKDAPTNRLAVAHWITQPQNPLTARVLVNRVWARLFGIGIVETEEDFGTQGTLPSHPQLLDWLAVDLQENSWSLKSLIRSMVLSATYRQSAERKAEEDADPRNRLLGRGPRFRLSGEVVRDQALAVSGLLTRKIGGPSVMPPQPPGVWKSTYSALKWQDADGPDRYRRGLYTYWKRTSPYPSMLTFDAGSGEVCLIRRVRTNTPLQALVTLNDPVFLEAAGALSSRMQNQQGALPTKIEYGFRLVLTRKPAPDEIERLTRLYSVLKSDFANDSAAAGKLIKSAGLKEGDAAMIGVANVLLNLDETLMKP